jgi:hypothetical protein
MIYNASMASAAAPSRPAAWETRAAAPGNSDADGDGAPVGEVPLPVGVGNIETELAVEVTVVEATVSVEVVLAGALDSEVDALADELAVGVALALSSGMEMVTPFWAQVSLTLEMTSASSAGVQAFWTQGVTEDNRVSAFLQWQAKSSRLEQPSLVNGAMKQLSYGRY